MPSRSAHLAGVPTSYDGDPDRSRVGDAACRRSSSRRRRAIPLGARSSRTASLLPSRAVPEPRRAAGSFCAENRFSLVIPCHRVVAANGIGGYGAAGPALKRRLLALEGVTPVSTSNAGRRRSGRARGDRAHRALRPAGGALEALFHTARALCTCGAGGAVAFHPRSRLLGCRSTCVRAALRAASCRRDPDVHERGRSTGRPAISCTSRARSTPLPRSPRRGCWTASIGRSTGRRAGSSRAPCCRGAYLRGAFLGGGSLTGPRSPHLEVRTPTHSRRLVPAQRRLRRGGAAAGERARDRTRARTRRAGRRSRATSWPPGSSTRCSHSRSGASSRRCGPRPTGSRTPTTRISSGRRTPRSGNSTRCGGFVLRAPRAVAGLIAPGGDAASSLPSCRCASWPTTSPPATKASMQRRLAKVIELGEA